MYECSFIIMLVLVFFSLKSAIVKIWEERTFVPTRKSWKKNLISSNFVLLNPKI